MKMTQAELERISDFVFKGIVSARQTDSNFWSSVKSELAVFTEKMDEMRREMQYFANEKKVQNGRVRKLENWRSYILGGLSLVALLASFAFYIYTYQQSVQDDRISALAALIKSQK